jgi:hypothetical protein
LRKKGVVRTGDLIGPEADIVPANKTKNRPAFSLSISQEVSYMRLFEPFIYKNEHFAKTGSG